MALSLAFDSGCQSQPSSFSLVLHPPSDSASVVPEAPRDESLPPSDSQPLAAGSHISTHNTLECQVSS